MWNNVKCLLILLLLVKAQVDVKTFRLKPSQDLKLSLLDKICEHRYGAATVVSGIGSLKSLHIRLATDVLTGNMATYSNNEETFEIVSLSGTVECLQNGKGYGHLHMSVADKHGKMLGGHLLDNNIVFTTAEITVMENRKYTFARTFDNQTNYKELEIHNRRSSIFHLSKSFMIRLLQRITSLARSMLRYICV